MELQSTTTTTRQSIGRTRPTISAPDRRNDATHPVHGSNTRRCNSTGAAAAGTIPAFQLHGGPRLNNSTNPPSPPQVMVKPAVLLRREERPQPVSFSVTAASQLASDIVRNGHRKWNPGNNILRASGHIAQQRPTGPSARHQHISTEVLSIVEGVHQVLFIPGVEQSAPPSARRRKRLAATMSMCGRMEPALQGVGRCGPAQCTGPQSGRHGNGASHGSVWQLHTWTLVALLVADGPRTGNQATESIQPAVRGTPARSTPSSPGGG